MIYDIIIVGAGPSGVSAAVEAKNVGLQNILLLEKSDDHSFSIRKLYVEGKRVDAAYKGEDVACEGLMCIIEGTKETTLNILDEFIRDYKLEIQYKSEVEKISKINDLFSIHLTNKCVYESKIVVIAIGVFGRPNKPEFKIPSTLKEDILFDVTAQTIENKKVLVVGGGNSAAEAVEFLAHNGNEVFLSYRNETFSKLNQVNEKILQNLFAEKKATPLLNTNIIKIEEENKKAKVFFSETDAVIFDKVVFQIGGSTPENFLKAIGLNFPDGNIVVDENFESIIPGLYLAGDLVANKKGTIIKAFNTGKKIVRGGICEDHLNCELE